MRTHERRHDEERHDCALAREKGMVQSRNGRLPVRKSLFKLAVLIFGAAACFLSAPIAAVAHHGGANYDMEKQLTMKGTVTDWLWANPHCFMKYDTTDDKGNVVHWAVEVSNPADMTKRGWSLHSFKPGDEVTVTVRPAKNGAPVGQLLKVVLANGQTLMGWPNIPAAPANPAPDSGAKQ
jgi:uncharacterized protein DUF6152